MIRIFRHYMPKGLLVLGVAEALILLFAMYVGEVVRFTGEEEIPADSPIFVQSVLFVAVMLVVMTALGLYQRDVKEGEWGYFPRLGASFLVGLAVMSSIFYVLPSLFVGRGVVGFSFAIALAGLTLARYSYIKLSDHEVIKRRVLVLGAGSRAYRVGELERQLGPAAGFHVVGYLPINSTHPAIDPRKLVGETNSLESLVRTRRIEEIVVGIRDRRGALPIKDILKCKLAGVSVVDLPTFFERETGRIELETLNTSWLIFSDGFSQGPVKAVIKRAFDMAVSVLVLLFAWPVMALTALLIYREDGGPIFYKQQRVGQGGRVFELMKFRSMRVDAEGDGKPQWARKDDDRTTRVGRFIRKVRIDELPQLFNVLRGDMSFVGPRPERPFFVEQLSREIPYYNARHALKPGITGWAQVRYPYGASVEDAIQKLQYDLYYVKNNTLFLDLIVLFQTARVVIWNEGAR